MAANEQTTAIQGNKGISLPDVEAVAGKETIDDWRKKHNIDKTSQIRITKVSHMRYQHPDLETITTFLQDFGMQVAKRTSDRIWYRGYGPDQYVYFAQRGPKAYLGGTFEVETYKDLVKASQLPKAGAIEKLDDAPGGGFMVTAVDPEGFPVNFIHGQVPVEVKEYPQNLIVNSVADKPRVKKFQRFEPGPAAIHKLGHFGLVVRDFAAQMTWYTKHFNLVPSDLLYTTDPEGNQTDVSIFAHIDRGSDLVDHHSIFFSRGAKSHMHHCSFEVHDYDTQHLGHQWLAKKGYKSVWGVGRHILGSQIFDYWWDTTGNMVEHYSDGDLVDDQTPVGHLPVSMESLSVWGPEVPSDFLD